jgi:hypothetical protein
MATINDGNGIKMRDTKPNKKKLGNPRIIESNLTTAIGDYYDAQAKNNTRDIDQKNALAERVAHSMSYGSMGMVKRQQEARVKHKKGGR